MRIRRSDLKPLVLALAIVAGLALRLDHADRAAHTEACHPCTAQAERV